MSITFLDYASSKYYAGDPIISDEEFDKLAEYYGYESVGSPVAGDRIAHAFPMWSLQKCYDDEPLICLGGTVATTRKLDGAAVANYYCEGKHFLSLTRGDGKEGLDITDKMRTLIPQEIHYSSMDEPITQITGEVVAPKTIGARDRGLVLCRLLLHRHFRLLGLRSQGRVQTRYQRERIAPLNGGLCRDNRLHKLGHPAGN